MHAYTCRNGHGRILLVGDQVARESVDRATHALSDRACPLCPDHRMPGLGGYCECCSALWEANDQGIHVSGVHLLVSDHAADNAPDAL